MRLIYNPSGTSHARDALRIENRTEQRRHFTAGEKMKIVREVDAMMATENLPLIVAATRHGVKPTSVTTWRKNAVALSDSSVENKLILHKGPSGIVSEVKVELIEFVEHWRLRGFPVTRMCLMRKVCKLKPEFLQKSSAARLMAISRFLMKNGMTHRVATHKAQRAPGEVRAEALSHLEVQVPRANDPSRHQDNVLFSLVAKNQLLTTKRHRGSLHHLRSAAGVAGTRAAPVVRRRPDDVDKSPYQTLKHNSTTGHGGGNCPLHRHHRDPLGNGLLVHWRGGVLYRVAQGGETRLLATIDGRCPGGRRHIGTRHDEVALGALRRAHLTVAACAIVVGVRVRAAFPSYHLGRRSHGWGGFIVILLYILLALFLGAHHLLLHAHHRAT